MHLQTPAEGRPGSLWLSELGSKNVGKLMIAIEHKSWTVAAKCRGTGDALFTEGADQRRARVMCIGCPVRAECLAEALDNRIEWGVWGGMTERERRQLLRRRPDVRSWTAVLLPDQETVS
jgi:WhiB family transcriptional regulator, redox-sensing transcriptional regulator